MPFFQEQPFVCAVWPCQAGGAVHISVQEQSHPLLNMESEAFLRIESQAKAWPENPLFYTEWSNIGQGTASSHSAESPAGACPADDLQEPWRLCACGAGIRC